MFIKGLSQKNKNVSDAYPQNWADLPAVQYVEEENKVADLLMIKNNPRSFDIELIFGIIKAHHKLRVM